MTAALPASVDAPSKIDVEDLLARLAALLHAADRDFEYIGEPERLNRGSCLLTIALELVDHARGTGESGNKGAAK